MASLHFQLVAPERVLFTGEVDAVIIPAIDGDMTVLPGHAPTMTILKTGFVVVTNQVNSGTRILVRGGFAEVNASGLTVLAERAMPAEELTTEKIDQEILDAEMLRDSAPDHAGREAATATIAHLEEAKAALRF